MNQYSNELSNEYSKLRDKINNSDSAAFSILEKIGIKDKDILDLGCGDGRCSCAFSEMKAKSVKGIDLSPSMIAKAQKRNCKADFIIGNCMNLPYKNESFDIIFSNFVLQHCKNIEIPIKEASRVLRKDGYFCAVFNTIITDNKDIHNTPIPIKLGNNDYLIVYDLIKFDQEFKNAFKKAGFSIIEYTNETNDYASIAQEYPYINDIEMLNTIVCLLQKK